MSSQSPDQFFRACEVSGLPELWIDNEPKPRVMSQPFAVVGNDPSCDLVLDAEKLSARHCYLQAMGSKVLCVDLNSEHGIDGGQGPVQACWIDRRHGAIVGGRVIRLAEGSASVRDDSDPTSSSIEGPLGEADRLLTQPLPRIDLEFQAGQIKTRWRMKRAVALVGTGQECTVRLNGTGIARHHCALVLTGRGLWVVDLLGQVESFGKGGLHINESRVRFSRLDPGDSLQVGQFRISMRVHTASVRRPRPAESVRSDNHEPASNEIELSARDRLLVLGETFSLPTSPEPETLRRAFEFQLNEQAALHRTEVESLRVEIDDLRDLVERLRSASLEKRWKRPRRGPGRAVKSSEEPKPRVRSVRILGSVSRRPDAGTATPPSEGESKPAANPGPGALAVESRSVDAWLNLDGGLMNLTNQARHLS